MTKCVFLDRDGVINEDSPNYVYSPDNFFILPGVPKAIRLLKEHGYLLIIVTNQSGIAQGLYTLEDMKACHRLMQEKLNHQIDYIYYAPFHESVSESLSRKPGSLMFERAIARFNIDTSKSWMIGDKKRDITPALKLGMKTIQVGRNNNQVAHYHESDLRKAVKIIVRE